MVRGVEGRSVFEKRAACNASVPGGAGLPGVPGGNGERRGRADQLFSLDRPLDLVGNIRALVAEARANWRGIEPFKPAMWLGENIKSMVSSASLDREAVLLFQDERDIAAAKQKFLWGLRVAWYLRAYQEIDGENNYSIFNAIQGYAYAYQTESVTLPPLGVRLLDAMAEALAIPHIPGQAKFNVEPLLTGEIDKMRMHQPPMPTLEEVRQAIAPKPENIIDTEQER